MTDSGGTERGAGVRVDGIATGGRRPVFELSDGTRFQVGRQLERWHGSLLPDLPAHVRLHEVDWIDPAPAGIPPVMLKCDTGQARPNDASTAQRERAALDRVERLRAAEPGWPGLSRVVRSFGAWDDHRDTYFLLEGHGENVWSRMNRIPEQRAGLADVVLRDGLLAVQALAAAEVASRDAHPANFVLELGAGDDRVPEHVTLIDFGHAYVIGSASIHTDGTAGGWAWVQPPALQPSRGRPGVHAGLADDAFSVAASAFIVATGGLTPWYADLDGADLPVRAKDPASRDAAWHLRDATTLRRLLEEAGCSAAVADVVTDILHSNASVRGAGDPVAVARVHGWLAELGVTVPTPVTPHVVPAPASPSAVSGPARSGDEVDRARRWLAENDIRGVAARSDFDVLEPWTAPADPWAQRARRSAGIVARGTGRTAAAALEGLFTAIGAGLAVVFRGGWRTLAVLAVFGIAALVLLAGWSQWWYQPFFVLPWSLATFTWWQWLIAIAVAALTVIAGVVGAFARGSVAARSFGTAVAVVVVTLAGAGVSLGVASSVAEPAQACSVDDERLSLCLDEVLPGGWQLERGDAADGASAGDGDIRYALASTRHDCLSAEVVSTQASPPAVAEREIPWGESSRTAAEDGDGVAPLRFAPDGRNVWQRHSWSDDRGEVYDRARSYTLVTGGPFPARDAGGVARATLGEGITQARVIVRETGCPEELRNTADALGLSLVAAVRPVDSSVVDPRLIQAHSGAGDAGLSPASWTVPASTTLVPSWPGFLESEDDESGWLLGVLLHTGGDDPTPMQAWVSQPEDVGDGGEQGAWVSADDDTNRGWAARVTRDGETYVIHLSVALEDLERDGVAEAVERYQDEVELFGLRPDGSQ